MGIRFAEKIAEILPNYLQYKYIVAVSGGLDSIVLIHLMKELVPPSQLVVAHFDHRTREGESSNDAAFVKQCADRLGLTFELGVREGDDTSENGLRRERRKFLEAVRQKHHSDYIVLAHHLQDQIETLLMRLLRGTGLDGLAAIEPLNGVWVRPLLGFTKETLEQLASDRGLVHRVDSSNLLPQNLRNDIRLNLLPQFVRLAEIYGGKEKWLQRLEPLFQEIRIAKKDLNEKVNVRIASFVTHTPFWSRVSWDELNNLSDSERVRALRMVFTNLEVETLSAEEMGRLDSALRDKIKNYSAPGIEMGHSFGFVYFRKKSWVRDLVDLEFQRKGSVVECEKLGMTVRTVGDFSSFEWRQFRDGDQYQGKKLKEYFQKKRIPKWERALIPLLALKDSNQVEWIFPEAHPSIQIEKIDFPFAPAIGKN